MHAAWGQNLKQLKRDDWKHKGWAKGWAQREIVGHHESVSRRRHECPPLPSTSSVCGARIASDWVAAQPQICVGKKWHEGETQRHYNNSTTLAVTEPTHWYFVSPIRTSIHWMHSTFNTFDTQHIQHLHTFNMQTLHSLTLAYIIINAHTLFFIRCIFF